MITYNDIYEALRREKYSEQLQPLSKSFIFDVAEYFSQKKEVGEKQQDLFSASIIKTKKQFENAISIFHELLMRRKKKLLNLAFVAAETGISKRDYENMIDFEKEMFDKIMKSIEESEKKLNEELNGKQEEKKNEMIVFMKDVERFVDFSGEEVGPFRKGEIVNINKEIARFLKEDGKAESAEE